MTLFSKKKIYQRIPGILVRKFLKSLTEYRITNKTRNNFFTVIKINGKKNMLKIYKIYTFQIPLSALYVEVFEEDLTVSSKLFLMTIS